jgi:hypothetical protein
MSYLYNYYENTYNHHDEQFKIHSKDKTIIDSKILRMSEKTRIDTQNIISNIQNLSKNEIKKYQLRGYYQYKQIVKQIMHMIDIEHELLISDKLTKNKVVSILGSDKNSECGDCPCNKVKYICEKTPIMYLQIKKV